MQGPRHDATRNGVALTGRASDARGKQSPGSCAHDGLSTPESFFGQLVDSFGSSRIIWGSNFPNEEGTLAQQVEEVLAALAFLPDADRDNILCRTAMALYPSLADAE